MYLQIYDWILIGTEHIIDINAFDHILFLVALCCVYKLIDWRKILITITAFTIGHCISLALSTFKIIEFNSAIVEFLIPITIFITCIFNIVNTFKNTNNLTIYINTIFFGLIHGMGFSTLLKHMLGKEESILLPLLSFNIGIEIGQLLIVSIVVFSTFILVDKIKINRKIHINGISIVIALVSLFMAFNRL